MSLVRRGLPLLLVLIVAACLIVARKTPHGDPVEPAAA